MSGDRLLVLSMGDPAGIGPEVLLKAAARWMAERRPGRLLAVAPPSWLDGLRRRLGLELRLVVDDGTRARPDGLTLAPWPPPVEEDPPTDLLIHEKEPTPPALPAPSLAGGILAWLSLAAAVDIVGRDPVRRALVTAPVCKESLARAGFRWPGHTEYLGWRGGVADPLMWMCSPDLSVGLVSNHDPLARLPLAITAERVERKARLALAHLARRHPGERLGVLALNPHAGDGGVLGGEEVEWLGPLLESMRREGLPCDGPLSADAALARGKGRLLAMYHDQGLPVFKLVAGAAGVNTTLGLPFVRCSPGHGTAFDIAGQGRADEGGLFAALAEAWRQLEDRAA